MNGITVRTPTLAPRSAEALARWLALNQPQVFAALLRASRGELNPQLNGLTDILSSIGTNIGSAVKSVGSFLATPQGLTATAGIGALYLQTKAQKDALKVQVASAAAGVPLPNINTRWDGSIATEVPFYNGQALTPSIASQLMPKQTWLPLAIVGGVVLLAGLFLLRR